jgi:signal transduction histidine kinase
LDRVQLKRIQIAKQFAEEELGLPLDPVSLEMAFLNLITNAIEAMEEDRGILRITTKTQGDTIQVIFTDNGSGISEDDMEKIFEPYFTGKNNGMGIGLSTTMSIIHAHHGRIDVQSELGTGTTFTISFQSSK